MSRNVEVFAIVKPDLSTEELDFINKIIEENMKKYGIKREKDTFYGEVTTGARDLHMCMVFLVTLKRYKEYFKFLNYNSYFEGAINVKKDIAGSEYNKIREIRWIPISEGYPDDSGQVLVTYKLENGEYEIGISEYWNLNESEMKDCPEKYGFGRLHENVVAWAQLPKPFIPSKDEDDFTGCI